MAAPKDRKPTAESAPPPYFIAIAPLYIGAARAHAPGDRVPADNVARHGWQDMVRMPDEPDTISPATAQGQAPKEGDT